MKYILILQNGIQFPIDENQKQEIFAAVEKGKSAYQFGSGEIIPLRPFPVIVLQKRAELADADNLAKKQMHRCRCGRPLQYSEECNCKKEDRSPFQPFIDFQKLPDEVKEYYQKVMSGISIPGLMNSKK